VGDERVEVLVDGRVDARLGHDCTNEPSFTASMAWRSRMSDRGFGTKAWWTRGRRRQSDRSRRFCRPKIGEGGRTKLDGSTEPKKMFGSDTLPRVGTLADRASTECGEAPKPHGVLIEETIDGL
jgi:hypothetical protein